MDIHEKAVRNMINDSINWIGSNNITNIARKYEDFFESIEHNK